MIMSPWREPLTWELRSAGTLPHAGTAYRVAGAFRGALLAALGDEGWLVAEDRAGKAASILAIPGRDRIVAVGIAPRATVADDAIEIIHEAAEQISREGFGRTLKIGRSVKMRKLSGPARRWRTLTPWIADRSLNSGGKGRKRTAEQLVHESLGKALRPGAQPAEAIEHAAGILDHVDLTLDGIQHPRDWEQPRSAYPPYTAFVRLAFRDPLQGPLLIGRGQYQGCGLLIADD